MDSGTCKSCNRAQKDLNNITLSERPLCNNCGYCVLCIKDGIIKDICDVCCTQCKRCEKKMLLDDWPETIICKGGLCEKCIYLCKFCNKYIDDNRAFFRFTKKGTKIRYCESCLREKREPKNTKYQYDILIKDDNIHTGWKKSQQIIKCDKCKKKIWIKYRSNQTRCGRCSGKKKVTDKLVDPSNNNKRYKLSDDKWILTEVKSKCPKCLSGYWVKKENAKDKKCINLCSNCNPSDDTKRYKYDKKKQIWIFYREKTGCQLCNNVKWMFIDQDNPDIRICKKCTNNINKA